MPSSSAGSDLAEGASLLHYRILKKLGKGGMGEVYLAENTRLQTRVAVKILPEKVRQDPDWLRRFRREGRAAARLDHPNIVRVYALEETGNLSFLVLEYVEGLPMSRLIPAEGVLPELFYAWFAPLADALSHAHRQGVVHQDLKPSNVMIARDGTPKILDFGLASLVPMVATTIGSEDTTLTLSEPVSITLQPGIRGTPWYMSPEQIQGMTVDYRSDVFSFGVVMYEAATGRRPFMGDNPIAVMAQVLQHTPVSVNEIKPNYPYELGRIIRRCLEKQPERRFASMTEIKTEIDHAVAQPSILNQLQRQVGATMLGLGLHRRRVRIPALIGGSAVILFILLFLLFNNEYIGRLIMINGYFSSMRPEGQPLSVAVMLFNNDTGDEALRGFENAVLDIMTYGLSQSRHLRTVSVDKMFTILQNETSNLALNRLSLEIGRKTGADVVISGSLLKSGNAVRIMAQIIDVQQDRVLKTEQIDEVDPQDLIAAVDRLASRIKTALEIEATGTPDMAEGMQITKTQSVDAYRLYVSAREDFRLQHYEDSVTKLRDAIQIDTTFAHAYEELANVYHNMGEFGLRNEVIARAVGHAAKLSQAEQLRILQRDAQFRGDLASQTKYLKDLIALQPEEPEWHFRLAYCYQARQLYELSEMEYTKAIQRDPQADYYFYMGYMYNNWERYDQALQAFEKAAEISPDVAKYHAALGDLYLLTGRYDEANTAYHKALDIDPTSLSANLNLGILYFEKHMFSEAEQFYRKYLTISIGRRAEGVGRVYLGELYLETGQMERAKEQFENAVSSDPYLVDGYMWLGLIALQQEDMASAQERLKRVEAVIKDNVVTRPELAYYLKGKIHQEQRRWTLAREAFEKALEMKPMNPAFIYKGLADMYVASGDLDGAVETYRRAIEINGRLLKAHFSLGQVYERRNQNDLALKEYETCVELLKNADEDYEYVKKVKARLASLKRSA